MEVGEAAVRRGGGRGVVFGVGIFRGGGVWGLCRGGRLPLLFGVASVFIGAGEDDAVFAEVGDEIGGERDDGRLDARGAVPGANKLILIRICRDSSGHDILGEPLVVGAVQYVVPRHRGELHLLRLRTLGGVAGRIAGHLQLGIDGRHVGDALPVEF